MTDFAPHKTLMSDDDREQIQSTIAAFRLATRWLIGATSAIVMGTVCVVGFVFNTNAELRALRGEAVAANTDRATLHTEINGVQIKLANIEGRWYKPGQ